jgi:hypothetical protein
MPPPLPCLATIGSATGGALPALRGGLNYSMTPGSGPWKVAEGRMTIHSDPIAATLASVLRQGERARTSGALRRHLGHSSELGSSVQFS